MTTLSLVYYNRGVAGSIPAPATHKDPLIRFSTGQRVFLFARMVADSARGLSVWSRPRLYRPCVIRSSGGPPIKRRAAVGAELSNVSRRDPLTAAGFLALRAGGNSGPMIITDFFSPLTVLLAGVSEWGDWRQIAAVLILRETDRAEWWMQHAACSMHGVKGPRFASGLTVR